MSAENARGSIRSSFNFNIFDGTPNEDSPWAMFIDPYRVTKKKMNMNSTMMYPQMNTSKLIRSLVRPGRQAKQVMVSK